MSQFIDSPFLIEAAGNKPKLIEEYFGQVRSKTAAISIARMKSPQGWVEPGQRPEFDEYTIVISGCLQVKTETKTYNVKAGQAVLIEKGEWVQYSSPSDEGAQYIAVCTPAFSPKSVHRDLEG